MAGLYARLHLAPLGPVIGSFSGDDHVTRHGSTGHLVAASVTHAGATSAHRPVPSASCTPTDGGKQHGCERTLSRRNDSPGKRCHTVRSLDSSPPGLRTTTRHVTM